MRITALGLATCTVLAAAAPAALAQQMALAELPRVGQRSLRFLDVGSLKRNGMEVRRLTFDADVQRLIRAAARELEGGGEDRRIGLAGAGLGG